MAQGQEEAFYVVDCSDRWQIWAIAYFMFLLAKRVKQDFANRMFADIAVPVVSIQSFNSCLSALQKDPEQSFLPSLTAQFAFEREKKSFIEKPFDLPSLSFCLMIVYL